MHMHMHMHMDVLFALQRAISARVVRHHQVKAVQPRSRQRTLHFVP